MKISGVYDLQSGQNVFLDICAEEYNDENLSVCSICPTKVPYAHELATAYQTHHADLVNHTDEMFLGVIYDKADSTVHVLADVSTSPLNFYYTENKNKIYYSTSLKWLLKESGIRRAMNQRAAKAFLVNGYVVGSETLVENVFKLPFGTELIFAPNGVARKSIRYAMNTMAAEEGKTALLPTIRQSIEECLACVNGEVKMPLSGGYDSNMILDTVLKSGVENITAFTVGGAVGKSEIGVVQENVSHFNNIALYTAVVDADYLDKLADIIWRLDGSVYESGVFLQYALADMACKNGAKVLICGESSDEVQSRYYYPSMKRTLEGCVGENERFFTYADPFIGTNMLVLKKSSLMLNSFGITGLYPFKNRRVATVASGLIQWNGTGKKYYKQQCKEAFMPAIAARLKTTGGTTNIEAVISGERLSELRTFLTSAPLLADIMQEPTEIKATSRTKSLRRKQGMERAMSEILDGGLIKGIKRVLNNKKNHGISSTMKKAYLVLFDKLFLSGNYDEYFEQDGISVTTSQLLK